MRAILGTTIITLCSLLVVACAAEADSLTGGRSRGAGGSDPAGVDGTAGADPTQPGTCAVGIAHPGFANTDFVADRKPGAIGVDRRRVKPYSAMTSEFTRALGGTPAALATSGSAFGDVPARWYLEPTAGAVSIFTTYSLAFSECYDTMSAPNFAQMPTADTAAAQCSQMQRKIWQRSATPDETKACSDFTLGLTDEPVARRRWAHACASIMSSAGFITY